MNLGMQKIFQRCSARETFSNSGLNGWVGKICVFNGKPAMGT